MKKLKITFSIILLSAFIQLFATDSKLGINSEKNFQLNPDINEPLLKFYSSAPLEDIEGYVKQISEIKSWATINPSNIESLKGEISFPVKTLITGISTRDKHLYSSTWMDADKYPDIKFVIKQIKNVKIIEANSKSSKMELIINGDFSMHGKSKNLDVKTILSYIKENSQTKKRASGDFMLVEGKFDIALKDFDVKGKEGIVGSKVGKSIKIEFKLFYNSK